MPVVVACRCGKRFAAQDHLYGQLARCPACGNRLTVERDAHPAAEGVLVACSCGRAFLAPESMRGQQARCLGCGQVIHVPGPDPLGLTAASLSPRPAATPADATGAGDDEAEIPWTALKLIGVVGGSILLVLIVMSLIIEYWPRNLELPKAEHLSKIVSAAKQKLAPPPEPADGEAAAETSELPAKELPLANDGRVPSLPAQP